jgi:hypothetical protein
MKTAAIFVEMLGRSRASRQHTAAKHNSKITAQATSSIGTAFGSVSRTAEPKRTRNTLLFLQRPDYCAMRSCESCVPICWNVVMIWFAVVSMTNLPVSAQFCSRVDCGSPPVFTWIV